MWPISFKNNISSNPLALGAEGADSRAGFCGAAPTDAPLGASSTVRSASQPSGAEFSALLTDAEAGQDNVERAAAAAADDLSLAQQTVMMTNFTSRLQERDEAIQEQLRSQLEVVLAKQESAHQRIILAMSTHSADTSDAGVDSAQ